jgi:ABC-type transport system involved in multi-copper enzyme maturation permease subunit
MFLDDIVKVLTGPHKAFKQIIENPKYLGVIVILLLFIGLQIGYEYSQFSRARLELTSPVAGLMQTYTNATNWDSSSNLELSNTFDDYTTIPFM